VTRRSSGVTLLEVIVVLAVLGLVLVMLTQGVRAVMRASDTYYRAIREQSDIVPVERALRRMIERMDPGVYPQPPVVRGTSSAVVFTTELPDIGTGGTLEADVRLEAVGGVLLLWWTPHTWGIPFSASPAPHRDVLLDHVARLEVSFLPKGAQGAWEANWMQPALPGVVRLRVVLSGGGREWPPIIARPLREQAEE
jgi:prepilin-type N-terminal cleavage/methylation domain-containing protein